VPASAWPPNKGYEGGSMIASQVFIPEHVRCRDAIKYKVCKKASAFFGWELASSWCFTVVWVDSDKCVLAPSAQGDVTILTCVALNDVRHIEGERLWSLALQSLSFVCMAGHTARVSDDAQPPPVKMRKQRQYNLVMQNKLLKGGVSKNCRLMFSCLVQRTS
jgi:hypothetical protein